MLSLHPELAPSLPPTTAREEELRRSQVLCAGSCGTPAAALPASATRMLFGGEEFQHGLFGRT